MTYVVASRRSGEPAGQSLFPLVLSYKCEGLSTYTSQVVDIEGRVLSGP
jgi:hypothetical protein